MYLVTQETVPCRQTKVVYKLDSKKKKKKKSNHSSNHQWHLSIASQRRQAAGWLYLYGELIKKQLHIKFLQHGQQQ
jgi:hypothetical protein